MVLGGNWRHVKMAQKQADHIYTLSYANVTTAGPRRTVLDAKLQGDTGGE